jgi:hypothetical protein
VNACWITPTSSNGYCQLFKEPQIIIPTTLRLLPICSGSPGPVLIRESWGTSLDEDKNLVRAIFPEQLPLKKPKIKSFLVNKCKKMCT